MAPILGVKTTSAAPLGTALSGGNLCSAFPARPVGRSVLDGLAKSLTLAHRAAKLLVQAPSPRQGLPNLYPKVL